jgi:hypothetical protein
MPLCADIRSQVTVMARSGWRLLAAFLLILVVALLRGHDSLVDRIPMMEPDLASLRQRSGKFCADRRIIYWSVGDRSRDLGRNRSLAAGCCDGALSAITAEAHPIVVDASQCSVLAPP